MVKKLDHPTGQLPTAPYLWWWEPRPEATRWRWCRVYHQSKHAPDGATFRGYGPLARLDHHYPADPPEVDASGRRILYVGEDLATSACEVFGESGEAQLCPRYRVSILAPTRSLAMFDLTRKGSALAIGALPSLADGSESRPLTQEWARAIYKDQPAGPEATGIRYRSAYNFGYSLALWDCDDGVEIVRDARGRLQDMALTDSRVQERLQVQMRKRLIKVTTVSSADCTECKKAP
ncbi:MAG: RES family NAD+ phosphorylase [Mycobacterium sp.]|uniref:RES family NAD+ phosphorylase n=1 Tax=Mycobacterium sp. TaxID=1785 RepID=UPI003C32C710